MVFSAVAAACGGDGGQEPSKGGAAEILSFEVEPQVLDLPGKVTASWEIANGVSMTLRRDEEEIEVEGGFSPIGSVEVEIFATTVLELVAAGASGPPAVSTRLVEVRDPAESIPLIGSFDGPDVVSLDEEGIATAILGWSGVLRAEELLLERDGEEPKALDASLEAGTIEVELAQETSFELVARNEHGEARATWTVRVAELPEIERFTADRSWVGIGEEVRLEWATRGAARVELWLNGLRVEELSEDLLEGTWDLPISFPSTVELRAYNEAEGRVEAQLSIDVAAPQVESFEVSGDSIWLGETLDLSWTSKGGSAVTIRAEGEVICLVEDLADVDEGSCEWQAQEPGFYGLQLTVSNASGVASLERLVFVGTGPAIDLFLVEPVVLTSGGEVFVSWATLPDPDGTVPQVRLVDDRGGSYPLEAPAGEGPITLEGEPGTLLLTLEASTDHPLSTRATATVEVLLHGAPEVSLVANPTHFDESHEDLALEWTSAHAEGLILYRIEGEEEVEVLIIPEEERAAGSHRFVPQVGGRYRIVAHNALGASASAEAEFTVEPPAVLSLQASPESIAAGQSVLLQWSTRMAEELELSIFQGSYVSEEWNEPYLDAKALGGDHLPLTDDCGEIDVAGCAVLDFPEGFRFPFGGEERTFVRVYGNGFLSFDPDPLFAQNPNDRLPSDPTFRKVHLAPFWDALGWDTSRFPTGNVHWLLHKGPAGEALVIQWRNVGFERAEYRTADVNFEVVLWPSGAFEYRYGKLDSSVGNASWAQASSATIGYQLPDGSDGDLRTRNQSPPIRGTLEGRAFLYTPTPELQASGDFIWHPYTNTDTASVTLKVRRGEVEDVRTITIDVAPRPELTLVQEPGPTLVDEGFRIEWETVLSTQLEIYDEAGALRCSAESQVEVDGGFCTLSEAKEGVHRYRIVYGTAPGMLLERTIEVLVYEPFGVHFLEADKEVLEPGEPLTLSWETFNAPHVSLLANGVELLPEGAPSGEGSLLVEDLQEPTTFVLRVTNALGLVEEATLTVEMWAIRLDVAADRTRIRPGDPVVITLTASGLGEEDPDPRVFGNFPMVEVTGEEHAFNSVAGIGQLIAVSNQTSGIAEYEFSGGFRFPFFGEEKSRVWMHVDGYLSFTSQSNSNANRPLPNSDSAPIAGVHLAPFWDDLHLRSSGELWVGTLGEEAYVFEWSKVSLNRGSANDSEYDLNFQVVLFRDGSFEYRFGKMAPPAAGHQVCWGDGSCTREAAGSSVTVGYQSVDANAGHTLHFGATSNAASEAGNPFPGGFANRSFRYEPRVGGAVLNLNPTFSQSYVFCADSGYELVCKSVEVEAPFGITSFTNSADVVEFGESITLSWETVGGKELVIWEGEEKAVEVFRTTDLEVIDSGSWPVLPSSNATYVLELLADGNQEEATAQVEVIRLVLSSSAPAASPEPGAPIQISWELTNRDPSLQPVVLGPMVEVGARPFAALDISADPAAEVLIGPGTDLALQILEFEDGFTFPFLGQEKSWVKVASEGYLSFAEDATSATASNQELPRDSATYRRIHLAPFWEDLHTRQNGRVLAKRVDPDTYVIQWSGTSVKQGSGETAEYRLNFMVVLHRSGAFEFRYGDMVPPTAPEGGCGNHTCEDLANGSSATIGYQEPNGTAGFTLHYASNTDGLNKPIPGGLSGRTFHFQPTGTSGSATVAPWDTRLYQICVFDPATEDVVCAEPMEVVVDWGIVSFDATPWAVLRGEEVTVEWEVVGLDELQFIVDEVSTIWHHPPVPTTGGYTHTPTGTTVYRLEGYSMGRRVVVEREVVIRAATVELDGPPAPFLPGEVATISWSTTQHEPGALQVMGPMVEVPAGPGDPYAFVDISAEPGATELSVGSASNGRAPFDLPFDFPYFGELYDEVMIYVDGYVSFDPTNAAGQGPNEALPGTSTARQRVHLAPFWDDLYARGNAKIFVYAPNPDALIIQWTNYSRNNGASATATYDLNFQVHLHRDGSFEYRYGKMAPPLNPTTSCYTDTCELEANGASATIGYALVDASFGYNVHYGGNSAAEMVPLVGGLENRAFRFAGASSGTTTVRLERGRDYTVCAQVDDFRDCQTIHLRPMVEPGDVMFTELMIDPTGGAGAQWFEVRNLLSDPIDLEGFVIETRTGTHTVASSVPVPAKGFVTLAASAAAGIDADYVYGTGLPLQTAAEDLSLSAGTATIATASWGGSWFVPAGLVLSLDPSLHKRGVVSNDDFELWCAGAGSPGVLGTGCLNESYDVDPSSPKPFIDISETGQRIRAAEDSFAIAPLLPTTFSMPFFDGVETPRWVSAMGWISFSTEMTQSLGLEPPRRESDLPRAFDNPESPMVNAFWDFLRCERTDFDCRVYQWEGQIDGVDALIVQWDGFKRGSGSLNMAPGNLTFQAQLYANGDVVVAFADTYAEPGATATQAAYYRGSQAWIGLEGRGNTKWVTGNMAQELELRFQSFHFTRK